MPVAPGYLAALRELTTRHGALLVFDEVVTGFRLAPGGEWRALTGLVPRVADALIAVFVLEFVQVYNDLAVGLLVTSSFALMLAAHNITTRYGARGAVHGGLSPSHIRGVHRGSRVAYWSGQPSATSVGVRSDSPPFEARCCTRCCSHAIGGPACSADPPLTCDFAVGLPGCEPATP